MTIYNLGSINTDWFYQVDHCPMNGETVAANNCVNGLRGSCPRTVPGNVQGYLAPA